MKQTENRNGLRKALPVNQTLKRELHLKLEFSAIWMAVGGEGGCSWTSMLKLLFSLNSTSVLQHCWNSPKKRTYQSVITEKKKKKVSWIANASKKNWSCLYYHSHRTPKKRRIKKQKSWRGVSEAKENYLLCRKNCIFFLFFLKL